MNFDEAIQQFSEAYKIITNYFGVSLDISPILLLDEQWYLINGEILYADTDEFDPDDIDIDSFNYSYEVIHKALWAKAEYTAARVNDGCGNSFCVILANKNRHKEFES